MIRLGVTNDFISLPITTELSTFLKNSQFQTRSQSLEKNYVDLNQGRLDAAFISPSDYAKDSSLLKILKDFAIYNKGESRHVLLFFQKNLNEIEEVVFKAISHYNNIALIVLNEFFEIDPKWKLIKQNKAIDVLLKSHPAVLQNGEEAMDNYFKLDTKIDIIDQWWDKTGLPFIHQVLAVHRGVQETSWVDQILLTKENGLRNLELISENYGKQHNHPSQFYLDLLRNIFQYTPDNIMWDECLEYFKYLYYYGKIPFIPEFHFV